MRDNLQGLSKAELIRRNLALEQIVYKTLWMARRYADMRSTYAVHDYNEMAQLALSLGLSRNTLQTNGALFARDGMGRSFDHLSEEEVALCENDQPASWMGTNEVEAYNRGFAEGQLELLRSGYEEDTKPVSA